MSEVKVNKISPRTACGTVTVGDSGDAVTVSAGVPVTVTDALTANTVTVPGNVVKSNAYQAADAGNIISQSGTTVTLGASGDTVALASGASQSGFGREGSVDWQTGSIKTGTFSAVSGEGYFVNTSGAISTVNLPAGVAGAIVAVSDYTRTFSTNNCTVAPDGTEKMGGVAADVTLSVDGQSATFVYVDGTEGWINVQETQTSQKGGLPFDVEYQVVAGGGGGGGSSCGPGSGGGGAGGYRIRYDSPLNAPADLTLVSGTPYSIEVGGGGAGGGTSSRTGTNGSNSVFSTITSAGGGGGAGGGGPASPDALDGGSGGGGAYQCSPAGRCGGSGNTPPVSPSQGNDGQDGQAGNGRGEGGGGAGAVGNAGSGNAGGPGGAGVASCISGSTATTTSGGTGGSYGSPCGASAPANSGNGGNGTGNPSSGGNGGSGFVYVRYPTSGAPPTVAQSGGSSSTCGSDTIITYTGPGTFTA
jgi:hypothetical protein